MLVCPLQTVIIEQVFSQYDCWRESGALVDLAALAQGQGYETYINDCSSLNMKPRNLERKAETDDVRTSP